MALHSKDGETEQELPLRDVAEILRDARLRLARLPVLDNRSADEIIGYD